MPRVAILVDLTKAQLDTLLAEGYVIGENYGQAVKNKVKKEVEAEAVDVQYREIRTSAPKIKNPEQYLHEPGAPTGIQGRPYKLNADGLRKIWDLYCDGYSAKQIAEGFKGLIGVEAVRRFIKKVEQKN